MLLREELLSAYPVASSLAHAGDAPRWATVSTALEAILRETFQPAELDPSRLHLRLLATPTTWPNVPRWHAYATTLGVGSCAAYDVGEPNEASLEDLRATLTDLLRGDDGGLVTVGEVRVMAGPGPKVHNLVALLAAADLSLEACAPVQVIETSRVAAGEERTVAVPEHRRLLHRLAHDRVLRGVRHRRTGQPRPPCRRGGSRPRLPGAPAEATETSRLRRAFLGRASGADRRWLAQAGAPGKAADDRALLLRARLRLIEEVLAGPDPWAAVFRADSALSAGLGRTDWNRLKDVSAAASRLGRLRNDGSHGDGQAGRGRLARSARTAASTTAKTSSGWSRLRRPSGWRGEPPTELAPPQPGSRRARAASSDAESDAGPTGKPSTRSLRRPTV